MERPFVIAEIGCNHKGDFEIAKEMIRVAALFCKADAVKFQKRTPRELLTSEQYNAPHPNQYHAYGETYGAHREALEFSLDQHRALKALCDEMGIVYSSSVWDMTSAREITELNPAYIKVGSPSNLHFKMLEYLCANYPGEIHVSFGMTTRDEEKKIVAFFTERGRAKDLVIYSCTSGYPVPFEEVRLYDIQRLRDEFGGMVKSVGFSGHHSGIALDVAATVMGATHIERHFTLNRTWKGTDHAASLEPDGMRRLVRDVANVVKSLKHKDKDLLDIEVPMREKLKWTE